MQVRILDSVKNEEATHQVELSKEALDAIKEQIRSQMAEIKGDLRVTGLSAELKP
jgi:hypothetical protein